MTYVNNPTLTDDEYVDAGPAQIPTQIPVDAEKDDSEKPDMSTIDPLFLMELAATLTIGDEKYGKSNWRENGGMSWERLHSAAKRHMEKWAAGEMIDEETDMPHLLLATSCLMMLRFYERNPREFDKDDRRFAGCHSLIGEMTMRDIKEFVWHNYRHYSEERP